MVHCYLWTTTWEVFLCNLGSLAEEHEMHQDAFVQRPISQCLDKNGTNKFLEL